MQKQKKLIIIFSAVLVVLVAVLALPRFLPDFGRETGETTTKVNRPEPVISIEAADVSSLVIINKTEEIELTPNTVIENEKEKTNWLLEDDRDLPYDISALTEYAEDLIELDAVKEIEAASDDLSLYGLNDDSVKIVITKKDNTKATVLFGDKLATGSAYYAVLEGSGRVCSVTSSTVEKLDYSRISWLDKAAPVSIAYNDLTEFAMLRARDNLDLRVDCEFIGDPADSETPALDFSVKSPIAKKGEAGKMGNLVNEILNITAVEYIELEPENLDKYGLTNPNYVFELSSPGADTTIKLGATAQSDQVYAISSNLNAVFTVKTSGLTSMDAPMTEMIDTFISLHNIATVAKIEADIYGTSFVTEIKVDTDQSPNDEQTSFTLNGRDAKIQNQSRSSLYSKFYQSIIGMTINGVDAQAEPENNPDAVLKFYLEADQASGKPSRVETVEFTRRDDYTDYVFIDGKYTGCYVNRDQVFTSERTGDEGIITAYKMLIYAMDNAIDGVFNTEEGYQLD